MISQSEIGSSNQIILIILWQVLGFTMPFTSLKLCKNAWLKPFCRAKPACFDFSLSNFHLQGHILSTRGVALTSEKQQTKVLTATQIEPICHKACETKQKKELLACEVNFNSSTSSHICSPDSPGILQRHPSFADESSSLQETNPSIQNSRGKTSSRF